LNGSVNIQFGFKTEKVDVDCAVSEWRFTDTREYFLNMHTI